MKKSDVKPMPNLKTIFDQHFHPWHITLPEDALHAQTRGRIQAHGWTINYRFDTEDGRVFLEYFATHRMTNDTLNRIYEDGTKEVVGFCQEFYLANDPQAEKAYTEHNRAFYARVKEAGLW